MNLNQILPNVFVGSCPATPGDADLLKSEFGVTAVLNLQTEEDFAYWDVEWGEIEAAYLRLGVELRRVPVCDLDPVDLRRRLPECVQALDALLQEGHAVYVHCNAGINRSPSTVVAYLHWIEGMGLEDAFCFVTRRRSCDPYMDAIVEATKDRAERQA